MYGVAVYRCTGPYSVYQSHVRWSPTTTKTEKKKIVCNARTVAEWRTVYVSIRFRLIEQHLKYCQYVRGVATGAESALISKFLEIMSARLHQPAITHL